MMENSLNIIEKMNPNQKINYDRVFQRVRESWERESVRPQILLHSCCAPCSTYSLEYLTQSADVTIYFANSNIHPSTEYTRRKMVQEQFVTDFNERTGNNVQFIAAEYEPNVFLQMVRQKHL